MNDAANQQRLATIGAAAKGAAKPTASKEAAAPKAAASTITPYLTGQNLMDTSQEVAGAENQQTGIDQGYQSAAAKAILDSGDIARQQTANVAAANNNAAARGIYQSGIRQGNVSQAITAGTRAQLQNQGSLALTAAQALQQHQQLGAQQANYFAALAAKSAENGAALPVAPGYDNNAGNIKGAATMARSPIAKAAGAAARATTKAGK